MTKTEVDALALPRKQFFLEMFTRDISLEDCTMDLIDNSLDSLIQKEDIDVRSLVFESGIKASKVPGRIAVTCSPKEITVEDDCGGIDFSRATTEVFCFGHKRTDTLGTLGAYGIGLKRAMFKIGKQINMRSQTMHDGFEMELNVPDWAAKEDDWTIPLKRIPAARSRKDCGTSISISDLHPEVKMRIADKSLPDNLHKDVAQTYAFFLDRCVQVLIDGKPVAPDPVPVGESDQLQAAKDSFQHNGTTVHLIAAIAPPGPQRSVDRAGWYLLCNGRIVVRADKGTLSGWGSGLPSFHNKYTRFVGLALFQSDKPLDLPWTTTKRDINRESMVFQQARNRMITMSKKITKFLDDLYPRDPEEKPEFRSLLQAVKPVEMKTIVSNKYLPFEVKAPPPKPENPKVKIVYNVSEKSIEKVRRCIKRPSLSNSEVGKFTFNHYLKNECGE